MKKYTIPALVLTSFLVSSTSNAACLSSYSTATSNKVIDRPASFRVDDILLRSGPGVQYCKVRELQKALNKLALITHERGNWRAISYEGKEYWIHQSLLEER